MQGEFAGPSEAGCPAPPAGEEDNTPAAFPAAKLHSFAGSLAVICHQDALEQDDGDGGAAPTS